VGEIHSVTCSFFKSNSENSIKICYYLTKLQTKLRWFLFMAHCVHCTNKKTLASTHRYDDHNTEVVLVTWCSHN